MTRSTLTLQLHNCSKKNFSLVFWASFGFALNIHRLQLNEKEKMESWWMWKMIRLGMKQQYSLNRTPINCKETSTHIFTYLFTPRGNSVACFWTSEETIEPRGKPPRAFECINKHKESNRCQGSCSFGAVILPTVSTLLVKVYNRSSIRV